MNEPKRRVLAHRPKAYRRRRVELWGGEPRYVHEIMDRTKNGALISIGTGLSARGAWESAQAHVFAEVLSK